MEIRDAQGESLPVRLHQAGSNKVMVVFPGAGYNPDKPLLYYLRKLALALDYDCLEVWRSYNGPDFQALSPAEAVARVTRDAGAVAEAVSESYQERVWAGKSMGTVALSAIMANAHFQNDRSLWLTPVIAYPEVFQALAATSKALIVAGSADPYLDLEALSRLTGVESLIFEAADHSLEVSAPHRSLQILAETMLGIERFLAR